MKKQALQLGSLWILILINQYTFAQNEQQLFNYSQILQNDPTIQIRWDTAGVPVNIKGQLTGPSQGNAESICNQFLNNNAGLFQMRDYGNEFNTIEIESNNYNWEHLTTQQIYQGIPVENFVLKFHIDDNRALRAINGNYLPTINIDTITTVDSLQALTTSRQQINIQTEDNDRPPKINKVIYNYNGTVYLAWKVIVNSLNPLGNFIYYVDAKTGEVIDQYNDLKYQRNRLTYTANNSTSLPGTLRRSEGGAAGGDAALDAAHDFAGATYDFYANNFGRDSYDNSGATISSTVHYRNNYNNAFWNGIQMVYGDGDGVIFRSLSLGLDVVAHELTHAVTENESGLIYRNQSGALNESLSDIFAALIDDDDWMLGEDIYTPNTPGDALRYLDNPPLGNQPDHMSNYDNTTGDNGGVHINSGIPNKAAYLLAEGGTHHGITVNGIGRTDMGKIFYEAQTNWMGPNDGFIDARMATLSAVSVVFPGDSTKYQSVANAWAAVGIGQGSVPLSLTINPSSIKVSKNGTETITASVTSNGMPASGIVVTFSSADINKVTISPVTGVTNNNGQINATIQGIDKGNTNITISATDNTNTDTKILAVKVPIGKLLPLALFICVMVFTIVFYRNKIYTNKERTNG